MKLSQGPGFPFTRKRVLGISEILITLLLVSLLLSALGLDSVEFWRQFEFLKGFDVSVPIS